MPSKAALDFGQARVNARLLITAASIPPSILANSAIHKAACLHAALAMLVAAWEAYLERLVREIQREFADTTQVRLSVVLSLLTRITEDEVRRFNTPNAAKSRELLITHTGYDPINDWQWSKGGLSGLQTRLRLDEILRIRHSFAHGFPVPTDIPWARNRNHAGILNSTSLKEVDKFLTHLTLATDMGAKQHLFLVYGVTPSW